MKLGLSMFLAIILFAMFAPLLSPYNSTAIHLVAQNLPPSIDHWFGTDELGRDLLTRTATGSRISLAIGVAAALIDSIVGILWGAISAMHPRLDRWMIRSCDVLASVPSLLLAILLTSILGSGIGTILLAMTCTGWISMARITRGELLHLQHRDFVLAAKSFGASKTRIFFRHLLPNAAAPLVATLTLTIPLAIFTEAFLSFLGLGVQAPAPSLGILVNDGSAAMLYYPWRLFFPALFLSSMILSLNLLGTALKNRLDPRLQNA